MIDLLGGPTTACVVLTVAVFGLFGAGVLLASLYE
jgi:hypothetical protein